MERLKIDKKVLTGIYLCNEEDILSIMKDIIPTNNTCYISKNIIIPNNTITVIDYINYMIRYLNINIKDKKRKINSSFKIIGFNNNYLDRNIRTLSTSELKLLQIITMLLSNKEIIIIEEPFQDFDLLNRKRIKYLIDKMIDKYNKTVIIITKNIDTIYKYTKDLIIIKNSKILNKGKTKDILTAIDFLKENNIPLPASVSFINLAIKTKKVKLDYNIDIRDIIKDIYKHV